MSYTGAKGEPGGVKGFYIEGDPNKVILGSVKLDPSWTPSPQHAETMGILDELFPNILGNAPAE